MLIVSFKTKINRATTRAALLYEYCLLIDNSVTSDVTDNVAKIILFLSYTARDVSPSTP